MFVADVHSDRACKLTLCLCALVRVLTARRRRTFRSEDASRPTRRSGVGSGGQVPGLGGQVPGLGGWVSGEVVGCRARWSGVGRSGQVSGEVVRCPSRWLGVGRSGQVYGEVVWGRARVSCRARWSGARRGGQVSGQSLVSGQMVRCPAGVVRCRSRWSGVWRGGQGLGQGLVLGEVPVLWGPGFRWGSGLSSRTFSRRTGRRFRRSRVWGCR